VILWRAVPWDRAARPADPGGALFFPRPFQGVGRHDNPARYGCLYASEAAPAAVAEVLAPFRGTSLDEPILSLRGLGLALAVLELPDGPALIDLDEPQVLRRERLRPSGVATRERAPTQAYAERLFDAHPDALGLRWWSTLEASWINVTLFDRAAAALEPGPIRALTPGDPAVAEAAELLGLA
jgi:hypothetical protein